MNQSNVQKNALRFTKENYKKLKKKLWQRRKRLIVKGK